jgi:hypothetical protein
MLGRSKLAIHTFKGAAIAVALSSLAAGGAYAQRAGSPFTALAGYWSGGGTIATSSGANERIRCKATYAVGEAGQALQQVLRCASDSYRFDVVSNVLNQGGTISGSWTETTRNASGAVSGRAADGQINAAVSGPGFTAALSITTTAKTQAVVIRPTGSDITNVAVNLKRD